MSERKEHFKHPGFPLGFGSVALIVGVVAVLLPNRESTEGSGVFSVLGVPNWGLGIALLALSALMFYWGIGQTVRRRKRR
ncbi:hypothetical protein D9V28_07090 [Mycetocola zhadangensis]|uniref:Uncharacterized protein n=1 Tax=Mycetocola zhadangensis TaxID=1164595 RepID=A0A3L7J0R3_9MICO|nr:hypothetical protein D9V28_07090 [Mycetocola zhadangensis]GGE96955.1 hypothetical protein GCM10011313_19990 [Mycetocola zhadangensis]